MANSNGWGDGAANNNIGWGQGAVNNSINWGDAHAKSWAGATDIVGQALDPAALAFITSTGITNDLQKQAINNLVVSLKGYGIWSKMKAVYPFVTDNRNLVSYSEDFSNAYWAKTNATISSNSTTAPNGTLTADTIMDNANNNFHYIATGNSLGNNGNNTWSIYAKANTLNYLYLYFYNGSEPAGKTAWFNLSNGTVGTVQSGITASIESVGNGWYRCSITRNFNFTVALSNCGVGVSNGDNVASYIGSNQSLFIWGAQVDAGSTATTYQPIATTQQAFIANQFKYNLVNPVDSDAAFRLVFNGGWTHSAQGATPNGTNGYADTKLNPSLQSGWISNNHMSFYSRTQTPSGGGWNIGVGNIFTGQPLFGLAAVRSANTALYDSGNFPSGRASSTQTDGRAFWLGSCTASNVRKLIKNGILINTNNTIDTNAALSDFIYIGAMKDAGGGANYYMPQQAAFVSIGDGLTDTEAANFYTAVQAYQTALSRQV